MIREALEFLANLSTQAVAPFRVNAKDQRAEHYLVGGEEIDIVVDPPPRDFKVNSLADLLTMTEGICEPVPAAVFYDEQKVVLVFDYDGHRVERATFKMELADSWKSVCQLSAWLEGKTLIRMLRTSLYGCLPDAQLADIIRRVKFEAGQTMVAETQRGKESLGREVTAKVSTAIEVPERVTLMVPVYSSLGETERYPLMCSVEIDPMRTEAFQLKPLPDEIERVQQFAVQSIGERLQIGLPEGVPAYYGSP
jgi:hypothetical protein